MSQFFDYISGIIDKVSNFLQSFFESFLKFFKYLGFALTSAYQLVDTLPAFIKVFGTCTVIILVLYMVLGRSAGGSDE